MGGQAIGPRFMEAGDPDAGREVDVGTPTDELAAPRTALWRALLRYPDPRMTDRAPSRANAALAGAAAGTAAIGINELLAGLIPGAPSFVVEVGAAVIALQPPGAKQFVVDLFGTNDKLVFNLLIVAVAIGGSAVLGIVARHRFGLAALGFASAGVAALAVSVLLDPLVEPVIALLSAVVSVGLGLGVLRILLQLGSEPEPGVAEMPDFSRRRFIGTSLAVVGRGSHERTHRPGDR